MDECPSGEIREALAFRKGVFGNDPHTIRNYRLGSGDLPMDRIAHNSFKTQAATIGSFLAGGVTGAAGSADRNPLPAGKAYRQICRR